MRMDPSKGLSLWPSIWDFLNQTKTIIDTHQLTRYQQESLKCPPDCFGFASFSDSIVATIDLSRIPLGEKNEHWHATSVFLRRAAYLCRKMFEFGLPVRGGIDFGDFYQEGGSFAGTPFVEAEELSGSLELSACVFTNQACIELDRLYDWVQRFNKDRTTDWFEYACEVKAKSQKNVGSENEPQFNKCRARVLDFYCRGTLKKERDCADFPLDLSNQDLEKCVKQQFQRHGKSIGGDAVKRKINNTTQLLEHAKRLRTGLFG